MSVCVCAYVSVYVFMYVCLLACECGTKCSTNKSLLGSSCTGFSDSGGRLIEPNMGLSMVVLVATVGVWVVEFSAP